MDETIIKDTSPTFFSGWRPLFGWISIVAIGLQFVIVPVLKIVAAMLHSTIIIPCLDSGPLITLVGSVLGMGGLRTIEKYSGLQDTH